jgi:hypothetical protein
MRLKCLFVRCGLINGSTLLGHFAPPGSLQASRTLAIALVALGGPSLSSSELNHWLALIKDGDASIDGGTRAVSSPRCLHHT